MGLSPVAFGLSYVWEAFALPAHAWRLAAIRRVSQRVRYQAALDADEEVALLRHAIADVKQMERQIERLDLHLAASRRLAVRLFAASTSRLERRLAPDFNERTQPKEAS
jgi:hypothetical protein